MIKEIRISGSGGQGVILAGIILAEAAGIYEGKEVMQVEDYGGAVRGGFTKSEVLIASEGEEIIYPAVTRADILVAMSQEAADQWTKAVKEGGFVLYDFTNVKKVPASTAKIYNVPITEMTKKKFGTELGANMVALGVMCQLTRIVSKEALEWAVLQRAPRGTGEVNWQALKIGFALKVK